jgi:tyrosyl-tRNA synthetase
MSISDEMMYRYYELLTDLSLEEIAEMRQRAAAGDLNPMDQKKELAARIIADFHSTGQARQAREEFERVFQSRQQPTEVDEFRIAFVPGKNVNLLHVLADAGLFESVSEAKRKFREGAVRINGQKYLPFFFQVDHHKTYELLVRVGHRHKKLILEPGQK